MRFFLYYSQRGFVFIELVIVLGILSTLLGMVIVNIGNVRTSAAVSTTISPFITDVKNQQVKAMVGDTEGRSSPDNYGIYIKPTSYILFHGQTYNASDPTNFSVPIDDSFQLSTTFSGNIIAFATSSGEIKNFVTGQDTVVVRNPTTGEQKTIQLNKYVAVQSVN